MTKRSIIKSTARYLPDNRITNDDLTGLMDTTDEWIRQRTGIEARYWVKEGDDTGTSDLALEAARIALARAAWAPDELDLIVMATMTSDTYIPAQAPICSTSWGAATSRLWTFVSSAPVSCMAGSLRRLHSGRHRRQNIAGRGRLPESFYGEDHSES